jgi:hypothetical protein
MSDRLTSAMKRLAAECGSKQLPPELEAALVAEFHREKYRKRWASWMTVAGAAAAFLVAALILEQRPDQKPPTPTTFAAEDAPEPEQPFIRIPYVTQPAPYERVEVVRMELPVTALIAAGFPMRSTEPGARVEADVMVGQDGRARAVRLISIAKFN